MSSVGTGSVFVSRVAHERERLLEEVQQQMAWGIDILHWQYYKRMWEIYGTMLVVGSGSVPSQMTQVGTGFCGRTAAPRERGESTMCGQAGRSEERAPKKIVQM